MQPRIQHIHLSVEHRRTDRHTVDISIGHLVEGDIDRRLGRTIQIVQPSTGQLPQSLGGPGRQRLSRGENMTQADAFAGFRLGHEHRQHRRHEMRDRDALGRDQPHQIPRIPMTIGLGHHQPSTDLQRPEELPHRHIERGRSLLQHHIVAVEAVLGMHPDQAVDDRRVRDRHTLRTTRRTRRENHIRSVRRPQRRNPIRIDQRRIGELRQIQLIDRHHALGDIGQRHRVTTSGEHTHRSHDTENMSGALRRMIRIQRHIRATGRNHRIHTDNQIQRTPHPQRHQRFRADTLRHEITRETIHPGSELGIGQTRPLERDRDTLRRPRHLRIEQRRQGHIIDRIRSGIPLFEHPQTLITTEQIDITDHNIRIGEQSLENPLQPTYKLGDRRLVEKIQRIRELGRQPSRIARRLLQGQLQIELRQTRVIVHAVDPQTRQFQLGLRSVLEGQHHLEQRMPRLRTRRIQHLYHTLERHIRMRERLQIHIPSLRQQLRKRHRTTDSRPQHQRIDEHADQIIQRRLTTTSHRSTNRNITTTRQPRQQHRQRRMHHHEQRRIVATAQFV